MQQTAVVVVVAVVMLKEQRHEAIIPAASLQPRRQRSSFLTICMGRHNLPAKTLSDPLIATAWIN